MNKVTKALATAALVGVVGFSATACDDGHHHHDTKTVKVKPAKSTKKGKK